MSDEELDRLKRQDLRQYAAAIGFVVDRRESSRNSTVMRKGPEKIIVTRKDGVFVYWSPHDAQDHGSLLDFVQRRNPELNLGGVRKKLRGWAGDATPSLRQMPELGSTVKDADAVRKRLAAMRIVESHPYLEEARGIPPAVLKHKRFEGTIRIDSRGAAVFAHVDAAGIVCGYELKNKSADARTFTGFAPGGRKGAFISNAFPSDRSLVITESGIDCLSHFALFKDESSRYVSIAGKPNLAQRSIMKSAMLAMPGGSVIVAATDADEAGRQLAAGMKEIFDECGRADLTFRRDEPVAGKDWNQVLTKQVKRPLPFRPEEPSVA